MQTYRSISFLNSLFRSKKAFGYFVVLIAIGLLFLVYTMLYPYIISGRDWEAWFRPAVLLLFSGKSPYIAHIVNPPWALLPLAPLALLSPRAGATILAIASPIIFGLIAYKLGAKPIVIIFFALSSPVIHNAGNMNIDWMPALGMLMPPQIGLFFILIKPQSGIGVAIYWLFEVWQKDRFKGVVKAFYPVTLAFLLSFVLYGFWPINAANRSLSMASQTGDVNLFPWAVPVGIGILFFAIRKKLRALSISASPLLSPYVAMQSWSSFLLGLVNYPVVSIIFCIGSWIITLWAWSR